MEKYNELFKTLVAAGLVMPNASGAYWFGQMIATLNREKPGWDQVPPPRRQHGNQ